MQIFSYLTFNGNCKDAMQFYQQCLGGELEMQTIGDSPLGDKIPEQMRKYVLHATLRNEKLVLMASDMVADEGLQTGNNVSLMLACTTEQEITYCYAKLAEGGKLKHELETTFQGDLLGGLTDKFGNNWLLHCEKDKLTKKNKI